LEADGEYYVWCVQHKRLREYVGAGDDNRGEQRRLLAEGERPGGDLGIPVVAHVRWKCDGSSCRPN